MKHMPNQTILLSTLVLCLVASAGQVHAQRDRRDRDSRGRESRDRYERPRDRHSDRNRNNARDQHYDAYRYGDVYYYGGRWVDQSRYDRSDWHGRYYSYRHHRHCTAGHCVRACRYFGWNYRGHHPKCRHSKCVRSCRSYRKSGILFRIFH